MPKITIYTQAYNTEKYIEQCVESVLSQTFMDFEYIIVDNGSNDNTKQILMKYAANDKRIKLIRFEENKRGFWIDLLKSRVTTEYITILDSDDYIEPNFLYTLYNIAINNKSEIVISSSCFIYMETGRIGYRKCNSELLMHLSDIPIYFRSVYQFFRTTWGKLFKSSLIYDINMIEFKSLIYGGDTSIIFDFLIDNKSTISLTSKVLHNYRVHNKSVSYEYNPKRFYSDTFLFYKAEKLLKNFGEISIENYNFIYLVYLNAISDTINVVFRANLDAFEKLSEIEKILKEPLTQQMFESLRDDNTLIKLKKDLLTILKKVAQSNIKSNDLIDLLYSNICFLDKNFELYVYKDDMMKYLIDTEFLINILNLDNNIIFENNVLLSWIKNKDFIMKYHGIIKDIYLNDFIKATEKIINILSVEDEIQFEEELLFMCLNLSATIENGNIFIYAKKLQTQFFIEQKRFDDATLAINDLIDMCPDDEEVIQLKAWLEAEYE